MKVTVKLHGLFRIGRFREEVREVPPGVTARAVAELLGLPVALVGIVLIRGEHAQLDAPLAEGDELSFLPHVEGG